jgi:hypothetical protein
VAAAAIAHHLCPSVGKARFVGDRCLGGLGRVGELLKAIFEVCLVFPDDGERLGIAARLGVVGEQRRQAGRRVLNGLQGGLHLREVELRFPLEHGADRFCGFAHVLKQLLALVDHGDILGANGCCADRGSNESQYYSAHDRFFLDPV